MIISKNMKSDAEKVFYAKNLYRREMFFKC